MFAAEILLIKDIPEIDLKAGTKVTITKGKESKYAIWCSKGICDVPEDVFNIDTINILTLDKVFTREEYLFYKDILNAKADRIRAQIHQLKSNFIECNKKASVGDTVKVYGLLPNTDRYTYIGNGLISSIGISERDNMYYQIIKKEGDNYIPFFSHFIRKKYLAFRVETLDDEIVTEI